MRRLHAFSLIELMVTLAVFGIAVMIAVPGFLTLSRSNRNASETNALVGALTYARSEASKRGTSVSVCTSSDGTHCDLGIGWDQGWIVFINSDNDAPAQVDAGETILRVYAKLAAGNHLDASSAIRDYISYRGDGFSNAQGQFIYCDPRGATHARAINVNRTGRISLAAGGGTCSAP